ncbi:hypothetical protein MML48_4g00000647 [Holotrichia oblita]|uniref:Uncharacterized protein n=1 Tax=Holotrichia oblita TaxID=644536 RepID=A0ACB9T8S4_HOLOL|nr:hypothetical protein MML48_4g00000647 [Holotrichia oblita]
MNNNHYDDLGGCKYAVAFLAWLHRRSEDPPSTSNKCYWKKSKLATIGTSPKFIKVKEIGGPPKTAQEGNSNFLEKVIDYSMKIGHIDSELIKYYKEFSPSERLSINYLIITMPNAKLASPLEFVKYCSTNMDTSICEEAFQLTLDQSDCPLWHELRYTRITALKAYEAAHSHSFDGSLVEVIIGASKLKETEPLKRGRSLEKDVWRKWRKRQGLKYTNVV